MMSTIQDKQIEKAIKNAFKDVQIYGTGIIIISAINENNIEVKSIKPFEARDLFQSFEDNIVKEL